MTRTSDGSTQSRAGKSTPGLGLAVLLSGLLTCWAAWAAWRSPVLLDAADSSSQQQTGAPWPDMRVEVNSASAAELALLPGLGPGLAQRIVDNRAANGPFKSIDDLDRVRGIGKAIIERLRPHAVADDNTQPK